MLLSDKTQRVVPFIIVTRNLGYVVRTKSLSPVSHLFVHVGTAVVVEVKLVVDPLTCRVELQHPRAAVGQPHLHRTQLWTSVSRADYSQRRGTNGARVWKMPHNTWPTRENASKLSLGWSQLL